jgi:hypothetical protein
MVVIIPPISHVITCDSNVEEKIKKAGQDVYDGSRPRPLMMKEGENT